MSKNAIPPGRAVVPMLAIKGAAEAVSWYQKAFGAMEAPGRITMPDGRIGHTEITVSGTPIFIADEFLEHNISPQSLGGSAVILHLYVEDVDRVFEVAVAEGALIVRPLEDQPYGDRSGKLKDPFGYTWMVASHIEDVSP